MPDGAKGSTARPLSPHLQIYRWPITMATSIVHRATGVALAGGMAFLAWWLIAAAAGPDAYANFEAAAGHPIGGAVLFGFVWSLTYHLLNGVRHLVWDLGYGFAPATAERTGAFIIALSILIAVAIFWTGYVAAGGPFS